MQPYGSPNPIQSRALVYCVAPQADCLSYVHHHHGRNRLNNPRARYFIFWLWTNRSNTHIGQWVRAGRPCFLSLPKLPSSDLRQAVESEQQQARSRLGSRSCQAGWQRRRARTSSCCPAGGASGARHLHRGAVEEKTKQRHILKKEVELIFGDGLTKKRTEDVADARQSPWGNGKSFLKELLGLLLVFGYFICDV